MDITSFIGLGATTIAGIFGFFVKRELDNNKEQFTELKEELKKKAEKEDLDKLETKFCDLNQNVQDQAIENSGNSIKIDNLIKTAEHIETQLDKL